MYSTITSYDVNGLTPCTPASHLKVKHGIIFTGVCLIGPFNPLLEPTFLIYLRSECISEKGVYQNLTFHK